MHPASDEPSTPSHEQAEEQGILSEPGYSPVREDLHIPDYQLLKRIGAGAYGEVWLAQGVTGALRAVKILWREDFELTRTFHREFLGIQQFEPISRGHPGLVDVLHVGWNEERGYYYYVMELADDCVEGPHITSVENYAPRTLASDLREHGRLDLHFCQEAGAFMADALHYMHEHGLTHRDIKPANVIYCGGVCKIADIGLVALSGERSFVGTEGYVPPEGPGTHQADLYSLGKVLYEMSSGMDRMEFPAVPDKIHPSELAFWKNLNQVIIRACAPDLNERFTHGNSMADALRAVTDQPKQTLLKRTYRKIKNAAVFVLGSAILGASWSGAKHQQDWTYSVAAATQAPLRIMYPTAGKPWQSSTGLWFSYGKNRHVADMPVDFKIYNQFLEATTSPFEGEVLPLPAGPAANNKSVSAVVVPADDANAFCEWLTQKERATGRMTVDKEIAWTKIQASKQPNAASNKNGWQAMRLEVVQATYGTLVITSSPSPAKVYGNDELLGSTPLTLQRVNSGLYDYYIHYPGYKWENLKGSLKVNERKQLHIKLKNINAVLWDKSWTNSEKIKLQPLGRVLMSTTEIRRRDYLAYLQAMQYPPLPKQLLDRSAELDLPITHVTHAEAQAYCDWLTAKERDSQLIGQEDRYRLPLDDEWSMAAGLPRELGASPAESHLRILGFYPWGFQVQVLDANVYDTSAAKAVNDPNPPKRVYDDKFPYAAPVGSFKPNARFFYDLSGNVWEWVEEAYGGKEAGTGQYGTVRGGSWRTQQMQQLLSSYRMALPRDSRSDEVGFRMVLSYGQPARVEESF
jgi:serine/threonine protein kinase/formylglycine-generating enzyme required for sulfatase activity